jgi:UDP-N-acetylglucosamine--N-acetylmuramyl-(pentapeptide) pyrophosphoryl-undecaprenol N-acetylglucosamine transferase
MEPYRVLIAASGTGGHLFPALFIAQALKEEALKRGRTIELHFVGAGRHLEAKILGPTGDKLHTIKMVGVNKRGLKGVLELTTLLPTAIAATWRLLKSIKPHIVIGVGGYASVLPIVCARLDGIHTWIHEAEVTPGLANKVLAPFAHRISLAFQETSLGNKMQRLWTGHPVRKEILTLEHERTVRTAVKNVLVLGGSQGSEGIDTLLKEVAPLLMRNGCVLRHQCREANQATLQQHYKNVGISAEVIPFIHDMREALLWSDLIISRAGAGAITDIAVANIPAILIPFPNKAIKQYENGAVMAARGKALVVDERAGGGHALTEAINTLLNMAHYDTMLRAPSVRPPGDAAQKIACGALDLMTAL